MMLFKYKKQKGFTILETLVAITIILIAITGPLDIIAHSLKASYYSRDEVTAFYLAQEAIEYVRNKRDYNSLKGGVVLEDWLKGAINNSDNNIVTDVDCLNDANGTTIKKCVLVQDNSGIYYYEGCSNGNCPVMKQSGSGVYGALNGDDTNFKREIYFTKVVDVNSPDPVGQFNKEIEITVNITWTNSFGSDNKFTITTHLFNWKITK